MRNILLGTTALVAATALTVPAMAAERIQLQIRGYHVGGITYTDGDFDWEWREIATGVHDNLGGIGDYNEINFGSDSEIHFEGMTTLDNGLTVLVHAELELEDNSDVDFYADQIDEVYIQFDGGFGRAQFGQNDGAMYQMHVTAPNTFVGHRVNMNSVQMDPFLPLGPSPFSTTFPRFSSGNPISTYGSFSGDNIKLTYFTPSFNGLQFGASYTPNPCKNDTGYSSCVYSEFGRNFWEAAASWEIALDNIAIGLSGGIGAGESGTSGDEPTEWTLGGDIAFGGFTFGGSYRDVSGFTQSGPFVSMQDTREEIHFDVGATYETGPWGFTVNYGNRDGDHVSGSYRYDDAANSWLAGATYMYGPGMQVGFGIQTLDSEGEMSDGSYRGTEGFEGTSFFIENAIRF